MEINKTQINYYLIRFEVKSLEAVTLVQLKKIFLSAIKFFKQGEISLDNLSDIASTIWPVPESTDSMDDEKLKNAIHSCAEVNFYIRRIPELDKDARATASYLSEIFEYYEENKKLLD